MITPEEFRQACAAAALACTSQGEHGLLVTASLILHTARVTYGSSTEDILETIRQMMESHKKDMWHALPTH